MPLRPLLAATLAFTAAGAHAATLYVGSGKTYATLAAAAAKANAGDTIVVFPGVYTTGATWYDSNLTIRAATSAAPGSVVVRGGTVGGKALFVTKGHDITVKGIRFESARVADGNGAGIRAEGRNLTVIDSQFVGNEMGILAGSLSGSTLTVRGSMFDQTRSRRSGSIGHSIYANSIDALVVENSTFTRGYVGHYIKSRAKAATITGNTIDDSNGTASYLIELAEGGAATIANNVLTKGANASNCCTAIAYGFAMYKGGSYVNPPGPVVVTGNRFTNRRASSVTFFANRSTPPNPATLSDNTMVALAGSIRLYSGPIVTGTTPSIAALDFGEAALFADGRVTSFGAVLGDFDPAAGDPVHASNGGDSDVAAFADRALRIPESGVFALLGLGIAGVIASRRRATPPPR
jgi:hypothetical protein